MQIFIKVNATGFNYAIVNDTGLLESNIYLKGVYP